MRVVEGPCPKIITPRSKSILDARAQLGDAVSGESLKKSLLTWEFVDINEKNLRIC